MEKVDLRKEEAVDLFVIVRACKSRETFSEVQLVGTIDEVKKQFNSAYWKDIDTWWKDPCYDLEIASSLEVLAKVFYYKARPVLDFTRR